LAFALKWIKVWKILFQLKIFKEDKIGNQEVSYGIEFMDWKKWLGMDIDPGSISNYSETDIIAHCLWEMIFYGYTQEAIKKQSAQLKEKANNK